MIRHSRTNKAHKDGAGIYHCAVILGMILHTNVPRVPFEFEGFHKICFGIFPNAMEPIILKSLSVLAIELVTMAVTLTYHGLTVSFTNLAAGF